MPGARLGGMRLTAWLFCRPWSVTGPGQLGPFDLPRGVRGTGRGECWIRATGAIRRSAACLAGEAAVALVAGRRLGPARRGG